MGKQKSTWLIAILTIELILGVLLSYAWVTSRLQNTLDQSSQTAHVIQGYQGILMDTGSFGAVVLNSISRTGGIRVNSISITHPTRQKFERSLQPHWPAFNHRTSIDQYSIQVSLSPSPLMIARPAGMTVLMLVLSSVIFFAISSRIDTQMAKDREAYRELIREQVAHDLGAPLGALSMVAESCDGLNESIKDLLISGVTRVEAICGDLRQANQLESRSVELVGLTQAVVREKSFEIRSKKKPLEIRASLPREKVYVTAQPVKMQRVISNILNNAVEASSNGVISIGLSQSEEIELFVQDEGSGIPPEFLKVIGKKRKSFNKPHGSGLGLFDAMNTLKKWNGKVSIQSEQGVGTRVGLHLPRANAV